MQRGLLKMLQDSFRLQHSEIILSLQYCKLLRHHSGTVEKWIGYMETEGGRIYFKENETSLKENFIYRINDDIMNSKVIKEYISCKKH